MIGIPSIYREEKYLIQTLDSIFKYPSIEDQDEVLVFLLLCDDSESFRQQRALELSQYYASAIDKGSLLILNQVPDIYKHFNPDKMAKNFQDSTSRILWRSRQNIDIALTMWFAMQVKNIDQYMLLEDDIILHKDYLKQIKKFDACQWRALKVIYNSM